MSFISLSYAVLRCPYGPLYWIYRYYPSGIWMFANLSLENIPSLCIKAINIKVERIRRNANPYCSKEMLAIAGRIGIDNSMFYYHYNL